MYNLRFFLIGLMLASFEVMAQVPKPYLLKDYGSTFTSTSTELYNFTALDGKVYYACHENCSGLWTTDGTLNGTHYVKGITAYLNNRTQAFPIVKHKFFFIDLGDTYDEVWASDGTSQGTVKLGDLERPTGVTTDPDFSPGSDLIYYRSTTVAGQILVVSDGTPEGTKALKSFPAGNETLELQQVVGNQLFFTRYNGSNATELWTTDGTVDGTVRLKNFTDPSVGFGWFRALNDKYVFVTTGGTGAAIHVTGKKEGTTVTIGGLYTWSAAPWYHVFNNHLVFTGIMPDGRNEMFASDGTSAGTANITSSNNGFVANGYLEHQGKLFFVNGSQRLYSLDTSLQSPVLVDDLNYQISTSTPPLFSFMGQIYFVATDNSTNTRSLWYSTGEPGSTKPFTSPTQAVNYIDAAGFYPFKGALYFWADSYGPGGFQGTLPYRSDGTPENTHQVKNINIKPGFSQFHASANRLFVTALDDLPDTNDDYPSLWLVDSLANKAHLMVPDGAENDFLVYNAVIMPLNNGLLVYNQYNSDIGREIYVIHDDGTDETGYPEGTDIPEIRIYPNPSSGLVHFELGTEGQVNHVLIHDATGRYIGRMDYEQTQTNFDLQFDCYGVYFITIKFWNGTQVVKRVVIA